MASLDNIKIAKLRQYIHDTYNVEGLKDLYFDLDLDHEEVGSDAKRNLIRELIKKVKAVNKFEELVRILIDEHPNLFEEAFGLIESDQRESEQQSQSQKYHTLPSRAPIVIAIEEEANPLKNKKLLRTERHLTISLDTFQIEELKKIVEDLNKARTIKEIRELGSDIWSTLEAAQPMLSVLIDKVKGSDAPQPIAWTADADLLLQIYRAISVAAVQDTDDISDLLAVGYGVHYFNPLFDTENPMSMQKRRPRSNRTHINVSPPMRFSSNRSDSDSEKNAHSSIVKIAQAVSNEVIFITESNLEPHLLNLIQQISRDDNAVTRAVLCFGEVELTSEFLHRILNKLPCIVLGDLSLGEELPYHKLRKAAPSSLKYQTVPTTLLPIKTELLLNALEKEDLHLYKKALFWTTWSWVGRPLFPHNFSELQPAIYPHLMDLRSIGSRRWTSRDWYCDRTNNIPRQYQAERLAKDFDQPDDRFHLYVTGAGGTGKSCFLRFIYESLRINKPAVLPIFYKVDAPSSEWEKLEERLKQELVTRLTEKIGDKTGDILLKQTLEKDLGELLVELIQQLRRKQTGINDIVIFIDQLERTFESGDNPELSRLNDISAKLIGLLEEIGIDRGIRIFIASRKQYLPDFLSSYAKASQCNLQFFVLQKINYEIEQVNFVARVVSWCKGNELIDQGVRFDADAARALAEEVKGHPLNMMLALIQILSEYSTGRITKEKIERISPWEKLFNLDEQLFAKDELDWYFLLAMAHARTEIVRFEEVLWRLRLVSPTLAERVQALGRRGVLERLWLLGHLGRTIHARELDGDPARFLEFFHANLRDHLISDVMNFGGSEFRIEGRRAGTPDVWRALDRLVAVAKEWNQSQQLLLREDVRVLMEQKEIFSEPINMENEGGPAKVESFYLLFLRDSRESRPELLEAAKECFVFSALVHDDLGRWAFKKLFPDITVQVAKCEAWLKRSDRDSRIRIVQYLFELMDQAADRLLAKLIFEKIATNANEIWPQLANILAEPLFAFRYRSRFIISLLNYLLETGLQFPADNWETKRFGEFCSATCRGDGEALLALLDDVKGRVDALYNHSWQAAVNSLLADRSIVEAWLTEAEKRGMVYTVDSRELHNYLPPRFELRIGAKLSAIITDEIVNDWHNALSDRLGVPLPTFTRTLGETSKKTNAELDDEESLEPIIKKRDADDSSADTEIELRINGYRVAVGLFIPDQIQTLRRHWGQKSLPNHS